MRLDPAQAIMHHTPSHQLPFVPHPFSLTKYISGASDIIAGVVCGSAAFVSSLMDFHTGRAVPHRVGPCLRPRGCTASGREAGRHQPLTH